MLQNQTFESPEDVRVAAQRALRTLTEDELLDQLKKLRDYLHDVIAAGGEYLSEV